MLVVKKLMQVLVIACMAVLGTQMAFANADKATTVEGADLSAIHRLAIAFPAYSPGKDAPTREELVQVVYDASSVARSYILSYDMVAEDIQKDAKIDIKSLQPKEAAKVYKEHVADYADAYVVLTVANGGRTAFFFEVYKSGTDELLYYYEIMANRSEQDNVATYKKLSEQFYKNFERAATDQQKDRAKKAKAN